MVPPPPNEELGNGHSGLGLPKTFNGYVVITLGVVQKKDRIRRLSKSHCVCCGDRI